MLTAADVRRWTAGTDEGVEVAATVGLGLPVYAAVSPGEAVREGRAAVSSIKSWWWCPRPCRTPRSSTPS